MSGADQIAYGQMGPPSKGGRTGRFLHNLTWIWLSVALNVVAGLLIQRYVLRKLGDDNNGLWIMVLALIEYYGVLDFGFRSATLKYAAHYYTLGDNLQVNRVINTALAYSSMVAALMLGITWLVAPYAGGLFHITNPVFPWLIRIVGLSWSLGMVFTAFGACLEAFQRYDITNRTWVVFNGLRLGFLVILLKLGYGLLAMALLMLLQQAAVYFTNYVRFRQAFPALRISPALASRERLREMTAFGVHSFTITIAYRILIQSTPLMIKYFLPERFVSFYGNPLRVLDSATNAVGQFASVTGSNTAELVARKEWHKLTELSVYSNRYCAASYLALAAFLWIYGAPLFTLYFFKPEYAQVLPILLVGITAMNSQYNSVCILTNMARQKWYARGLLVEALLSLAGMWYVIPHFGIMGVAWVASVLMFLNRGVLVAWLLCHELKIPLAGFVWKVYAAPVGIAAAVLALLAALRGSVLPGASWLQLGLAATIGFSSYAALAFFLVLKPEHREFLVRRGREIAGLSQGNYSGSTST
jgi:O-antigen/teichoic acid export membrane protein